MIDLRSDTVTKPTPAMRAAMAAAEVGDDVYGDDPTANALEARVAELLGKEAAVLVPTGSMSNQIAIRAQTEPGDLVILDRNAHIVRSEGGAGAVVSGVTMRQLDSVNGIFSADAVAMSMGVAHPFNANRLSPRARLLCVENTSNSGGGTVWPLERLRAVCAVGREHGLALHLDGARLWHASAASGVAEADYAAPFDSVNVCFSKGLGAPIGSALAGSRTLVERARRFKQMLGGGIRQAGIIAAAALYALDHNRADLPRDVRNARVLAEGLAATDGITVDLDSVQSNIVRFSVATDAGQYATLCHAQGVHVLPNGLHGVRALLHRDISDADVLTALDVFRAVAGELQVGRSA
ncbi:MAG: GntG family PLP-dependent aldolase [Gemmatimonadetes bacterium]|nr:GntG family PLP-dependent aldolase [Gemmatimonadota bacterium]